MVAGMILTLAIAGFRSIRDLVLPLERLTVVTGANGVGKSNLYRALRLLAEVAEGGVIASLAREGGLPSAMWAGPERITSAMRRGDVPLQGTVRRADASLRLGFASDDYGYAIDFGLPVKLPGSMFNLDPEIKAEALWAGEQLSRRTLLVERRGGLIEGLVGRRREVLAKSLPSYDSMMAYASSREPFAELLALRERMRDWRFYDHLRTDRDAPARQAQIGTRTPVLAADGADIAAAIRTIVEIGDKARLEASIDGAFPDSRLEIAEAHGRFELSMRQPGLLRPLRAAELSEGTLRFLLLAAALLTPRPPELLVFNEPEAGLNASLIAPLAELVVAASARTQILVVSHSRELVAALGTQPDVSAIHLRKDFGVTIADGPEPSGWTWLSR